MLMDLKWIVCVFRFRILVLAWSNDSNVEICYCMSEVSTYDMGCSVWRQTSRFLLLMPKYSYHCRLVFWHVL